MNTNDLFSRLYQQITSTSTYEGLNRVNDIDVVQLEDDLRNVKISKLGTPILDSVQLIFQEELNPAFEGGNRIQTGIARALSNHGYNDNALVLQDVSVSVSSTNNIVRTSVNGLAGTFKEFYNQGDYSISLTGSMIGTIPFQDDVRNLQRLFNLWTNYSRDGKYKPLVILSRYFAEKFGIYTVVITDFNISLSKEYNNVVDYTINLESDNDLEIIYSEVL